MRNFNGLDAGDAVGNRKSQREIRVPHDGIGNYLAELGEATFVSDQIGNSIDSAPTHQLNSHYRKRSEQAPHQRMGRYIIGGVNPVVAGLSHLIPENMPALPPPQRPALPSPGQNVAQTPDKRLLKLFELSEDERFEYTLTSTPEEKRLQAERVVKTIFEHGAMLVQITTTLLEPDNKPSINIMLQAPLFKTGELPLAALNFLVHKIVNKAPADRIRLAISNSPVNLY